MDLQDIEKEYFAELVASDFFESDDHQTLRWIAQLPFTENDRAHMARAARAVLRDAARHQDTIPGGFFEACQEAATETILNSPEQGMVAMVNPPPKE